MRRILVPYLRGDAFPPLAQAFAADDAVVVSKGPLAPMLAAILDRTAARVAATDEPVLVVSADPLTALGVVAGLQRRGHAPGILWLSARAALHTPRTTSDGDLGGMTLAMLTGRTGDALTRPLGLHATNDDRIVLAGTRSIDAAEQPVIDESRLAFANLATFAEQPLPPGPWYLHVDADLLDPTAVPPLRRAVPDGPTLQEVADALRPLAHNPMLAAIGLVCSFTPPTLREPTALRPFLSLTDRLL